MTAALGETAQVPLSGMLSATLTRACDAAAATGAREVVLEHVLAALCDDPDAMGVLDASQVYIERLKTEAIAYLAQTSADYGPASGPVSLSEDVRRILDAAAAAARGGRRREINGAIVLAAIIGDGRSVAAQMLQAQGLTFDSAIRALQAALAQPPRESAIYPAPAEDVLARARERVQSRQAPSLREIMSELPRPIHPPPPPHPAPSFIPPVALAPAVSAPAAVEPQPPIPQPAPVEPAVDPARVDAILAPIGEPAPPPPAIEIADPSAILASVRPAEPPQPAPDIPPVAVSELPPTEAVADAAAEPRPGFIPMPAAAPPLAAAAPAAAPSYPSEHAPAAPFAMPPLRADGQPLPPPAFEPAPGFGAPAAGPLSDLPPGVQPADFGPPGGGVALERPRPSPQLPPPIPVMPPASAIPGAPPFPMPRAAPPPSAHGPMLSTRPDLTPGAVLAPQPSLGAPPSGAPAAPAATLLSADELVSAIPSAMRTGLSEIVELRIARSAVRTLAMAEARNGGIYPGGEVSHAISVRLRAPEGGFHVEANSPETQWLEAQGGLSADDTAVWRFLVTPQRRGWHPLQATVSVRMIGPQGVLIDAAQPEQTADVKVRANLGRMLVKLFGWMIAAGLGFAAARYGEAAVDALQRVVSGGK